MSRIIIFATALILIGVGAWAATTSPRVAASTSDTVDQLQIMTNAI